MFGERFRGTPPPEAEKPKETSMKWVDLVSMDVATQNSETVARVILDGGVVRIEGDPIMKARLEKDGVFFAAEKRTVTPADGEAFLTALGQEYKNLHLFATDVQEGDEPVPYEAPEMTDIPPSKSDRPAKTDA
jgi:hypothetical protein